jgi:hypothetical protein
VIPDKIALLMAETGCEKGEAELALEMCGYEVEQAGKAISRLHKNIVVLKGKFIHSEQNQFGILLVILNAKSRSLLRSRAVLSYNPAVYSVSLDKDWFEFEKSLFACRLWEGSLQAESLEIEQALANHFRATAAEAPFDPSDASSEGAAAAVSGALKPLLRAQSLELKLRKDVLDLGQFQSLRNDPGSPAGRAKARTAGPGQAWRDDGLLILKVSLEEASDGVPARELRAGDIVAAQITDPRDIAQYLARLFGGYSEQAPLPIMAPLEAIEAGPAGIMARGRFSLGGCGDSVLAEDARFLVMRNRARDEESPSSWWKRFFRS